MGALSLFLGGLTRWLFFFFETDPLLGFDIGLIDFTSSPRVFGRGEVHTSFDQMGNYNVLFIHSENFTRAKEKESPSALASWFALPQNLDHGKDMPTWLGLAMLECCWLADDSTHGVFLPFFFRSSYKQ